uniref:Uncharacterized protein n=1 Tax=Arundo donax TaxID=35708 RepID=A0A0A9BHH6_ARUDO
MTGREASEAATMVPASRASSGQARQLGPRAAHDSRAYLHRRHLCRTAACRKEASRRSTCRWG